MPKHLVLLLLLTGALAPAAEPGQRLTRRVVILVVDGPRWSETWGEPTRQYIPHRATELAPQGVLFTHFRNQGPTYTNAGHTALVTGVYQEINNSGLDLPAHAGLFQHYLAATRAPATDAWLISSKDKLRILSDCLDPAWRHAFTCSIDCGVDGNGGGGYRDDAITAQHIQTLLPQHHPHLVLINLKQVDACGHAKDWPGYLKGIRDTDEIVAKTWDLIQHDAQLKDQTALFITNDHGRHLDGVKDGFVSHGDDCPGCHQIELLAMGPDFKRGATVDVERGQIDVAVTAAALLGFALPDSSGKVIPELFADPALVPVIPAATPAPTRPAP
jgi:hypothetical protein